MDPEYKGSKNKQLCSDDQHLVDEDVEDFNEKPSESISSENNENAPDIPVGEVIRNNSSKPSKNSYVKYKLNDDDWTCAKILSKQPKQTGQYRDWLNVHVDGQDDPIFINWDHVDEW